MLSRYRAALHIKEQRNTSRSCREGKSKTARQDLISTYWISVSRISVRTGNTMYVHGHWLLVTSRKSRYVQELLGTSRKARYVEVHLGTSRSSSVCPGAARYVKEQLGTSSKARYVEGLLSERQGNYPIRFSALIIDPCN